MQPLKTIEARGYARAHSRIRAEFRTMNLLTPDVRRSLSEAMKCRDPIIGHLAFLITKRDIGGGSLQYTFTRELDCRFLDVDLLDSSGRRIEASALALTAHKWEPETNV